METPMVYQILDPSIDPSIIQPPNPWIRPGNATPFVAWINSKRRRRKRWPMDGVDPIKTGFTPKSSGNHGKIMRELPNSDMVMF